jgi:hypothetical protein
MIRVHKYNDITCAIKLESVRLAKDFDEQPFRDPSIQKAAWIAHTYTGITESAYASVRGEHETQPAQLFYDVVPLYC